MTSGLFYFEKIAADSSIKKGCGKRNQQIGDLLSRQEKSGCQCSGRT